MKPTSREQKLFTVILIFYWVSIFVATHIPVPGWTRKMGVSDKTMHFVAYMVLTLLLWLGTSFEKKADWKKIRPWLLLTTVILYGLADELLQHFSVERSVDIQDFTADVVGSAVAMMMVTILSGWHAVMILVTVCPLFAPAIVRSQLITQGSLLEVVAYMAGFAIITAAWIKYLPSVFGLDLKKNKFLPIFFAPPAGTVIIAKLYAHLTDKPFGTTAILVAFVSIILTLFIGRLIIKNRAAT
jgi:hypothetical protein